MPRRPASARPSRGDDDRHERQGELPDEPIALRRALLTRVKDAVGAERSVFFGLALIGRQRHFVSTLSCEPDTQAALAQGVEARPALGAASLFEDGVGGSQPLRFASARTGAPLPSTFDPLNIAVYQPFGVLDHARLVVHDGRRFVGWLGVQRSSAPHFGRADLARLDNLGRDVAQGLVRADRAERADLAARPQLVVDADGVIQLSSEAGRAWSQGGAAEAIAAAVRDVAGEGGGTALRLVSGAEATIARLFGGRESYLVTLAAPVAPELEPDTVLTERQHEIAVHAAAGLSRGEIATRLAISEETVRHHLKLVYERLGVSSRVELANALRAEA